MTLKQRYAKDVTSQYYSLYIYENNLISNDIFYKGTTKGFWLIELVHVCMGQPSFLKHVVGILKLLHDSQCSATGSLPIPSKWIKSDYKTYTVHGPLTYYIS